MQSGDVTRQQRGSCSGPAWGHAQPSWWGWLPWNRGTVWRAARGSDRAACTAPGHARESVRPAPHWTHHEVEEGLHQDGSVSVADFPAVVTCGDGRQLRGCNGCCSSEDEESHVEARKLGHSQHTVLRGRSLWSKLRQSGADVRYVRSSWCLCLSGLLHCACAT